MKKKQDSELVSNRKAYHDYEILDKFEAGIVLYGTEVKSLKDHGGALQDAYVTIDKNELYLLNSSIAPYKQGNVHNHEDRRKRKLLMHRKEIDKLAKQLAEKGLTLIPLSLFLKNGKIKLSFGLGKGKKAYDKRASLKEKDLRRSLSREED